MKSIQIYCNQDKGYNDHKLELYSDRLEPRSMGWQSLYEYISDHMVENVNDVAKNLKENFTDRQLDRLIKLIKE